MSNKPHPDLDKAEFNYDIAELKLRQLREKYYPVGSKGRCKISGYKCEIIPGSLYADQLNTTQGHMSWRNFEYEQ